MKRMLLIATVDIHDEDSNVAIIVVSVFKTWITQTSTHTSTRAHSKNESI